MFGCDLSLESANKSKATILADSPAAVVTVIQADATSSSSMQAFVDACVAQHGRIDILINNVGRSEPGDPASMSEETWDRQIDVNLKSVYLTSHLVLPIMSAKHSGAIVNISSIAGLRYM